MHVDSIDHLVLTVSDIEATCAFYATALGMVPSRFGSDRKALNFGAQKINLHALGQEIEPKAFCSVPGSVDLCLITSVPISEVIQHLNSVGVTVIEGPVERTGARGQITSVYLRDPDQNLIEVSNYL